MDLGDSVLGSAPRAEAVRTPLEVRLEDRLEHQLQAGLHDSVGSGRDAQAAELAVRLGDHRLPHPDRAEPAGREIISQRAKELPGGGPDGPRSDAIDPGRACALVDPDPVPRHDEERRVSDEVVEIIEPAAGISSRPSMQLRLHPEYPLLGLIEVGPRRADIHQRPPRSALMLRTRLSLIHISEPTRLGMISYAV